MKQIISLSIVSIAFDTAEMRRMNRYCVAVLWLILPTYKIAFKLEETWNSTDQTIMSEHTSVVVAISNTREGFLPLSNTEKR